MAIGETPSQGVTIRDLLDAGLHFGHQTKRWNPKMKRYIFDKRNGIHIIDLTQSLALMDQAMVFLRDMAADGKSILFVGTKKQAQTVVREAAETCGQHSVTHRWLGGTLTNMSTIRNSVRRMRLIEAMKEDGRLAAMHKQEASKLMRELAKLQRNLSGIANLSGAPGAMFVVDITRESNAVKEANRMHIPVVAIVDTCCDPDPVDYVIPGNDDSIRAVKLVCGLAVQAIRQGGDEYALKAAEIARRKEAERAAAEAAQAIQRAQEKKEAPPAAEGASAPAKPRPPRPRTRAADKDGAGARPRAARPAAARPTKSEAPAAADEPVAPAPVEAPAAVADATASA